MSYQLDENFAKGQPQIASLRKSFGHALAELAKQDERIVALSADLSSSVGLGEFAESMGARYIEVGIAEQNLVSVASGLAHMGKIPFAASYAVFNPGRNWEQIRTTVCLNNQSVKIIGSHAGLNVGPDGASHQMLEDIALTQVLPNMVVLAPGDAIEAQKMAKLMIDNQQTQLYSSAQGRFANLQHYRRSIRNRQGLSVAPGRQPSCNYYQYRLNDR